MFILGFNFPASEGNKISDEKVLAKLDEAVGSYMPKIKSITLYAGNSEYKTLTNTSTVLSKGLVNYFFIENERKDPKYMTFTDKYQISALCKNNDTDIEALEIAKFFEGREQITVEVA